MIPEERIIYADMNMPLRVKYGSKKVFCTFDTIEIRTIMEKMGEGKKHFRLPDGYYIEFVNTDRHSERPVVGKICREPTEQEEESQEEIWNDVLIATDDPHRNYKDDAALLRYLQRYFTITRKQ